MRTLCIPTLLLYIVVCVYLKPSVFISKRRIKDMKVLRTASYLAAGCCLLFGSACSTNSSGGNSNGSASSSGGGAPGSAATAPTSLSPAEAMTTVMNKMLDAKSFRANMTGTSGEGQPITVTMEFAAPDRYHMIGQGGEYIIVGHDSYLKAPGRGWMKSPYDVSAMMQQFRDPKFAEELNKASGGGDVKLVGSDVLDGTPALVYEYTTEREIMGTRTKSQQKTWVGASDGLPRKMEVNSVMNGKPSKMVIIYSDYGSDIKIEAPAMK